MRTRFIIFLLPRSRHSSRRRSIVVCDEWHRTGSAAQRVAQAADGGGRALRLARPVDVLRFGSRGARGEY